MNEPVRSAQESTRLIRGEYLEIPGLHLTRAQIQRLWDLDHETCSSVLDTLLYERFLVLTCDRRYILNGPDGSANRAEPRELAVCRVGNTEIPVSVR
jgi:hypothetical protein